MAITPVVDAAQTPGGGAAVGPFGIFQSGAALGTVTAPSVPTAGLKTVTAASFPTATIAPQAGGTTGTGATVPAGPAAELRQAAFTAAAPDNRASLAIRTALAQLGLPYVWGGDGPTHGDPGFDCSGLTSFSYGTAGVLLPRTAHTQYNTGPHVPAGAPLQPGDLVFYGTPAFVHHVGMYLGEGRMVNAPTFGKPVQVAFYRYRGDDYLGATRPAAAAGSLTSGLLPEADPVPVPDVAVSPAQQAQQEQQRIFPAPSASLPAVLPQPGDPALPSEQQSAARAIAESDAAAIASGRPVIPQAVTVGPGAGQPLAGKSVTGSSVTGGSGPVAGSASSSSAPITTSPVAPAPASSGAPAAVATSPASSSGSAAEGVATSPSVPSSTPGTSTPAGAATSASSTTASPTPTVEKASGSTTATSTVLKPADPAPSTSTVVKVAGSSKATSTLMPTSMTATSKPVATKTAKVTVAKAQKTTATSSAAAVKVVTTPDKQVATKPDDPTSTTKTSSSKTSTSKTKSSSTKSGSTKSSSAKSISTK
jgi:cell wall-associated NlpC family hydrolase